LISAGRLLALHVLDLAACDHADHEHHADAGRKAELGADAQLAEIENAHSYPSRYQPTISHANVAFE
jgi:hypothetical protein